MALDSYTRNLTLNATLRVTAQRGHRRHRSRKWPPGDPLRRRFVVRFTIDLPSKSGHGLDRFARMPVAGEFHDA
jgi:hypothetical protein